MTLSNMQQFDNGDRAAIALINLVICDHMRPMGAAHGMHSDYEKFTAISRAMKQTAVEANVPVLLVSQTVMAAVNQGAASVVLADVERYGGDDSPMLRWARLVAEPPAYELLGTEIRRAV